MKQTQYAYDRETLADFAALCQQFTGKSLQSPFRSTVPLLSLVRHSQSAWRKLMVTLGAPADATVFFEYKVKSPKPRGRASQSDALVLSDSTVWAFEAKWTEPRDKTVARRLSDPEQDGADPRLTLNGWLARLQPFALRPLHLDDFSTVVYQTLHRAASACTVAAEQNLRPELVYLHFHYSAKKQGASVDEYIQDLRHLHALLGDPPNFKFHVVELMVNPTEAFMRIENLPKGQAEVDPKI
jgi:hypothetical protein